MSETTSTNISVAQDNATESIQANSTTQSRMTGPGSNKRICFYKSGDPRFHGIKMVVTNRTFKTFDALLDSLSKKVPLPFGVRNITTPRGIHQITTLEELEDGKSYICSHQKKVKPINLERASKKPLLWQSSRPISARRRAMHLTRPSEIAPFQRENTVVLGSSKNFVIYKNGEKEHKYNLILNKKSIQSFDAFLDQISEALQFPVFKLYSTDGRRILSTHALLLSSGSIVAAGREPFKPGNYDSETEFLPAKLPGIFQRVIPKSKAKSEMRSQVKSNEPVTIPTDQEQLYSSANVFNDDRNLADFSHTPDNEIHLTEQWPKSGEYLPVISPGDNIEKSVHLNCDGTMTVEMKVRFKIREEETINWSTTVSRASLAYNKNKIFCSSVNPEVQDISIRDSQKMISSVDNNTNDESKDSVDSKFKSHVEKVQNQIQDNDVNTNKSKTSPARKEKQPFYRPPTPGIRKGQERRLSVRRASEGILKENMKQMLSFNELEQDHPVNDIADRCRKHMLTTADFKLNRTQNQTETDYQYGENTSKLEKESDDVQETTRMELLHRNTVYEKGMKKSDQSNYMCFTRDRPHSAGMQIHYQDPFKFKEIKRSISASVTFSDPTTLDEDITHAINKCELGHKDTVSQIASVASTKSAREAHYRVDNSAVTSRDKMIKGSDNDTGLSNDNNSISSVGQKKKKKKKIKGDSLKQTDTNIDTDLISLEPPQVVCGISGGGMNPAAKNIMFEEIFPPQISSMTSQSELGTVRKIKGDKQMAKVKPRSVKTNDKSLSFQNQNSEESEEKKDSIEAAEYNTTIVSNGSILYSNEQAPCPLTLNKYVPDKLVSTSGASKRSHKAAKKPKLPKKKTKNIRATETKTASSSKKMDSERVLYSPTLPNALESYVQSWLKNIFPNAALPVLQMISSARSEDEVLHSSIQPHAEVARVIRDEICANANSNRENQGEPIHPQLKEEKEMFIQKTESFNDVSVMEKSKSVTEFFTQQCIDLGKTEELINWIATHQHIYVPLKKASTDAAVQVENETFKQELVDYIKCDYMGDMFSSQNATKSKYKQLEKSLSLPNSPSKPGTSSSQLLLAWLIVLHLKQGMHHTKEDFPSTPCQNSAIFTLLQSLKKIAITEKADDLKAAILSLQESAIKFDSVLKNGPTVNKPVSMHDSPQVPTKRADSGQLDCLDVKDLLDTQSIIESCEKTDLLQNIKQNIFADESDDLTFFATEPYRELSDEQCQTESGENPEQCSMTLQETPNITGLTETEGLTIDDTYNTMDLSQRHITLPMSHITDHTMESSTVSPKKVSKVKMMVQEMEQRKYSSHGSEHPKCLQSPISSDWSDYRQDSEEYMSDNQRSSSEIMTESGEEQVHKKVFTTGYVKRTIERLYGKAESKVKMLKTPTSVSPIDIVQTQPRKSPKNKIIECSKVHRSMSKENISRSISSPGNKIEIAKDNLSLKSASLPLLEGVVDHDNLISQKSRSSQGKQLNKNFLSIDGHEETGTDVGVLIDKGRWLLKENHLVRRSPPELTGMYANLDTTSADTLLDNTSDDVPYRHYACYMNQPLAEVSSSELEDMAKPLHNTFHYFSMPHGSDSEPFSDTFSTKSKVRPKSSDAIVKSKTHNTLESIKKCSAISTSLTSFATVDFHYSENKVHPMPRPDAENTSDGQGLDPTSTNRRQIKEQDSLDKLQVICGQHCPILTAIITPMNEKDRGFVYCRNYDIENLMMLHSLPTTTAHIPLLNKCLFVDENNNIENNKMKLPVINFTDRDTYFPFIIDYKEILEGVKAIQSMIESRQSVSTLHPISIIKMTKIMKQYSDSQISNLFQDVTCMGNDENNNILFSHK